MKKSEVDAFVSSLDALIKENKGAKKVKISINATIEDKKVVVYSDEIEADELQTSGYDAFRREVNDLTTYWKGLNISGSKCELVIGEYKFSFLGGKFVSNLNTLVNGAVLRVGGNSHKGMLGKKHDLKKEEKKLLMDKIVPKGSSLLQWISVSAMLDNYTDSDVKQLSSAIVFDSAGELVFDKPIKEIENTDGE